MNRPILLVAMLAMVLLAAAPGLTQTAPDIEASPKRFCCDRCKQQESLVRRVAALLVPLGKDEAWTVLLSSK